MPEKKIAVNADTLNAMVSAMGALAMSVAHTMPPAQRAKMAEAIAAIAKKAEADGDQLLETLLIDMHRAIR